MDDRSEEKKIDELKNIPAGAQEVFIAAPTEDDAKNVYDLNDITSRMKVKQRQKTIEERGVLKATDLLDTQMDLRNQQMQEYKDRMRKR